MNTPYLRSFYTTVVLVLSLLCVSPVIPSWAQDADVPGAMQEQVDDNDGFDWGWIGLLGLLGLAGLRRRDTAPRDRNPASTTGHRS